MPCPCSKRRWFSNPFRRRGAWRGRLFLFRHVGDQAFGGQDHRSDGSGIFKRTAHDLERVNDAGLDHVAIFVGEDVIAEVLVALFLGKPADVLDDD